MSKLEYIHQWRRQDEINGGSGGGQGYILGGGARLF